VPFSARGTTWVNLWAAWCEPCKEEIPTLQQWEAKLRAQGLEFRVVLVSLDDDARQLRALLESQPDGGIRETYWLREGEERKRWLGEAGISEEPELPVHLAISNELVRCRVQGAVTEHDFADVQRLATRE
jgi:thiol-disulfide isomerase/thioredoxin